MSGTEWKLDNDYKTVTITFPTDPPVDIRLDTSQIDEHLQRLGQFRSRMKPDIAFDWALGQKVGAVPDPRYVTEPEVMQGNSLLHIRRYARRLCSLYLWKAGNGEFFSTGLRLAHVFTQSGPDSDVPLSKPAASRWFALDGIHLRPNSSI